MGIIWLLITPEPPRTEMQIANAALTPKQTIKHVLGNRSMWLIAIAMMGFAGSSKGVMGYLPLFLRNGGWTATAADGALAAFNAASTIVAIPLALLSDKLGLRKAFLLPGLLVTFVSMGLLSVVTGPVVWLLAILAGIFREMIWAIAATTIVETEGIGSDYAGTGVGMEHAFTRIGYTFAPPAGNAFVPIGAGLPFVFWAVLSLFALIAFSFVKETGHRKRVFARHGKHLL
jgi:predicted MFS family arabinose efflux permease